MQVILFVFAIMFHSVSLKLVNNLNPFRAGGGQNYYKDFCTRVDIHLGLGLGFSMCQQMWSDGVYLVFNQCQKMLEVTSEMLDIIHKTLMLLLKTSTERLLADCLAKCTDILHLNKKQRQM